MLLKAMLVDDEPLALVHMQQQLSKIGGVDILASYIDIHEAMAAAIEHKPDLIFIDIKMPEVNGLEAAERLNQQLPDTRFVFVTAHDEFAIQAFELNAMDYLLKPVEQQRLRKTLSRLAATAPAEGEIAESVKPSSSVLRCFQYVHLDDHELSWRTSKARELFAFFVHRRNQLIRKDYLIELFWPDSELKRAYTLLYSTIYQIRKTLSALPHDITVNSNDLGYQLDLQGLQVDVDQWEHRLSDAPPLTEASYDTHLEIFEQYPGDYLAEHDYPWAEAERERLRTLWYQHGLKLSDFLQMAKLHDQALHVNNQLLQRFPYCEHVYWQFMKLYHELGDRVAVLRYYEQLTNMLAGEFGIEPSGTVKDWIEQQQVK